MSAVESALVTLVQSNITWYFGQKSLFVDVTASPIASLAVGQLAKIYCAAKESAANSLRFAFNLTETTATKILNTSVAGNGLGKTSTVAEDTLYSFVVSELINVLCPQELRDLNKREAYFYYGIKMMGGFLTRSAPQCIQECEVARLVKTAIQRPPGMKIDDDKHEECKQLVIDIARVLWETAQEKIAREAGVCTPSKFLHATIEFGKLLTISAHIVDFKLRLQHKPGSIGPTPIQQIKLRSLAELSSFEGDSALWVRASLNVSIQLTFLQSTQSLHNSLSSFFTTVANSVADEAKSLAKMFTETTEQAVSTVTGAVKEAQVHISSMVMTQSLAEFVKASAEGMELFSEYFWTSKPSVWDVAWELPEANAILDDEDLQLFLMNQEGRRRRPVLHVGER